MPEKSIKKSVFTKNLWVSLAVILLLIPGTLMLSRTFGQRRYYLCSVLFILYSMVPFFLRFEKRKPQAREVVSIAVMCAIAVASRAAFIMIPHFKPMTGIIMITGMAFGPEAGFLTGAISGFVSNFIFGQGPWTPWQMFAFGVAGFLAGLLGKVGILKGEKKLSAAVAGFLTVLLVVGPLLDTSTLFSMTAEINAVSAGSIYLSGLPVNTVHATATFLTIFLLSKLITEKLNRIKIKYGMMDEEEL